MSGGVGLDINFPLQDLLRQVEYQRRTVVPQAAKIALQRVGVSIRTEASKVIRQKLAIKSGTAKQAISLKTERGGLLLIVRAVGKPIPLKEFQARPTREGVTYRVSPARGRRAYVNRFGKSFVVQSRGGNVFARTTVEPPGTQKARITKIYGPSVPQTFARQAIQEPLAAKARARFPLEFERAVAALSRGAR